MRRAGENQVLVFRHGCGRWSEEQAGGGLAEQFGAGAGAGDGGFAIGGGAREVGADDAEAAGCFPAGVVEGEGGAGGHEAVVADEGGGEIGASAEREQRVDRLGSLGAVGLGAGGFVAGVGGRVRRRRARNGKRRGGFRGGPGRLCRRASRCGGGPSLWRVADEEAEGLGFVGVDGVAGAGGSAQRC